MVDKKRMNFYIIPFLKGQFSFMYFCIPFLHEHFPSQNAEEQMREVDGDEDESESDGSE